MSHKVLILICLLLTISPIIKSEETVISQFNSSNYVGWSYIRPNFVMTQDAIANNEIVVYNDKKEGRYMLESPAIEVVENSKIIVNFEWRTTYYNQDEYNIKIGSPTVSIIDAKTNDLIESKLYQLTNPQLLTTVIEDFNISKPLTIKVLISAENADIYCAGSIKKVKIKADHTTGIDKPINNAVKIITSDSGITINNAKGQEIRIFNMLNGLLQYNNANASASETIAMPIGMYCISVDGIVYKIIIP